jgi:hypothetical protein
VSDPRAYRVRFTANADHQLAKEFRRSRRQWGRDHELRFRADVLAMIEDIARAPHQHRARPELRGVRVAWVRTLQLVYLVDDDRREVLFVGFVWRQMLENALKLPKR